MNTNYNRTCRIKQFIVENNITQPNIEDKTGIKQSVISRQLNSESGAGATLCYEMILHYAINPKWLEYGEEPMTIDYEALKNESITKESQNESIKNKQETIDAQKVTINSLQKNVSTLEVRICELENQLQEARHALKNTVGAV